MLFTLFWAMYPIWEIATNDVWWVASARASDANDSRRERGSSEQVRVFTCAKRNLMLDCNALRMLDRLLLLAVQNSHHVLVDRWRDGVLNANEAAVDGLQATTTVALVKWWGQMHGHGQRMRTSARTRFVEEDGDVSGKAESLRWWQRNGQNQKLVEKKTERDTKIEE